jgi:hypothetical protein
MEIEYTLLPEDLHAFARYHRKLPNVHTSFSQLTLLGVVVIMTTWGMSLLLTAFFFKSDGVLVIGVLIGWLGAGSLQGWLQACTSRSIRRTECEDPRSEWAFQDLRVVLSPDGLHMLSRASASMYDWSRVWHLGVTEKHVFLCITRNKAIVIPRRVFRDQQHFEEFIALAGQYQQGCSHHLPKPTGIIAGLPPQSDAIARPLS